MLNEPSLLEALKQLSELRQSAVQQGTLRPQQWQEYLGIVTRLCRAKGACLLQANNPQSIGLEQCHNLIPTDVESWLQSGELQAFFRKVIDRGYAVRIPNPQLPWPDVLVAVCLPPAPSTIVLLSIAPASDERINEVVLRALMLSDVLPQSAQTLTEPASQATSFSITPLLGLVDTLYRAQHFQTAALALVNGIVAHCPDVDQAVIGWREGAYIQVRALSHFERFERKTDTMRYFESALEEAADQGITIHFGQSAEPSADWVSIAHKQLTTHLGSKDLTTLPLYDAQGETVGALMLVSYSGAIEANTQTGLQFITQTAISHLKILREDEAGLIMRAVRRMHRSLGQLFGPENLWVKVSVLLLSTVFLLSLIIEIPHRVRGSAQFVTDETRLIVAPFSAMVTDVFVTTGHSVSEGQPLLTLDTQELLLQLAELASDLQRNQAELDRARAEFTNVDMAIASARVEQTLARMGQVNYLINQATLSAPFAGVVVEGDRRHLLASPVNRGQALMRIANPSELYLLIEITDANIQHIEVGSTGEFSLVSQPQDRMTLVVEQIVPMATLNDQGSSVFEVKAQLTSDLQPWWRPGMTGVARIDAGQRSMLWVWFHSTWNRIRLLLWF